ncbi:IS66 family insertion sequence element accessory protein TnpB [Brevibacillus sp. SAFN-007a]|uniref:IS66 family insertion sequence element accessory protein TnpB n=1 Tax=Brevibacillus sp. SAFN-007a TaxID=3436862 RepID=UPI003F80294A
MFCNRDRNKLKILYWEHNGFWLFYRRLKRGTFQWPTDSTDPVTVSNRELRWLLDGLSLSQRQAHLQVTAQTVI